jgi:hypothetical protein
MREDSLLVHLDHLRTGPVASRDRSFDRNEQHSAALGQRRTRTSRGLIPELPASVYRRVFPSAEGEDLISLAGAYPQRNP